MKAIIFAAYLVWFLVLVRLLFVATGNPSTSSSEILGSHLGLAFWLLLFSLIPYFIARFRAKKSGVNVSWPYVMAGTTIIALTLAVGGFYERVHAPQTSAVPASASKTVQPTPISTEVRSLSSTTKECLEAYATSSSSVGNMEILREFCATAFDPNAHPVDRSRALCQVQGWTENPTTSPTDVSMECYSENPLPSCPQGQQFELHNKRCEIKCDALAGYAPDGTGQTCVHVCPQGKMAIYAGYATKCS